MKKVFVVMVAMMMVMSVMAGVVLAKDQGAAAVLSCGLAGIGEWYNGDFRGSFPWGECILGYICPCVHIASAIDAAAGKADDKIRIDFWSAPR